MDRPVSGFFPTLGPQIILIKVYQHHIPDMDINVHMALYSSSINSFTSHSIHSPIYMIASIIQCRIKTMTYFFLLVTDPYTISKILFFSSTCSYCRLLVFYSAAYILRLSPNLTFDNHLHTAAAFVNTLETFSVSNYTSPTSPNVLQSTLLDSERSPLFKDTKNKAPLFTFQIWKLRLIYSTGARKKQEQPGMASRIV